MAAIAKAALEFKHNKPIPAETYFHKARILYEAVYAEVDGEVKQMDPKLKTGDTKCQTACEGLLPNIRGHRYAVLSRCSQLRWRAAGRFDTQIARTGFSDLDVMTNRVTEIAADHSIDPRSSSINEVRFSDGGGKGGGRGRGGGGE